MTLGAMFLQERKDRICPQIIRPQGQSQCTMKEERQAKQKPDTGGSNFHKPAKAKMSAISPLLVKPDKGSKFRKPNKPRAVIIQRKPGLGFSVMAEKRTMSPSLFHKALKPADMGDSDRL